MPTPQTRVVGSGYSTFTYAGKIIAYLEQVEDTGQRPFSDAGAAHQFIQPLGWQHPKEIAVSRVLQGGMLNLTIRELFNTYVWEQLAGLAGARNIGDVFALLAARASYVTCQTVIRPPNGGRIRGKNYHNCVVVDVNDNDTITVGGLAVTKGIQVAYTHTTKLGG